MAFRAESTMSMIILSLQQDACTMTTAHLCNYA